ncbi:hypothetical protein GGR97_003043 [Wenyingzhuangia aestuarii]|nr:hypothetical protein [Wenyingzhuangia aestuarii]
MKNIIRNLNIISLFIFIVCMIIEQLRFIGAYFFAYVVIWVYLIFLITEIRFLILTKPKFVNYLKENLIGFIGLITFPLLYVVPILI